jgi:hypothetical protein
MKLSRRQSALEMTKVGRSRWRIIEVAGYWVTFRFATPRELQRGLERRGLRYVGRIDPIEALSKKR